MKPEMKFENGFLIITLAASLDFDRDGIPSATTEIVQKINLAEAINEAFKTDSKFILDLIGKLK